MMYHAEVAKEPWDVLFVRSQLECCPSHPDPIDSQAESPYVYWRETQFRDSDAPDSRT